MTSRRIEPQIIPEETGDLSSVGLFAGIGGIEEGLRRAGFTIVRFCEIDPLARRVLRDQFGEITIDEDVLALEDLPAVDLVSAGFPCQDLSQAGTTKGIEGPKSSLGLSVLDLLDRVRTKPTWLLLENVPFMLHLDKGRAMAELTSRLERVGWRWAYRTVDARSFGLPQRRRRVFLLASKTEDPATALFGDGGEEWKEPTDPSLSCGFYWTEGNTGVGWAVDATPPLKGGSGRAIPSPPAVWHPSTRSFSVPSIEDAEALQGFPRGWTSGVDAEKGGRRKRWRLVGNAVSVPVAEWVGKRLRASTNGSSWQENELRDGAPWPSSARGDSRGRFTVSSTEFPVVSDYLHLADSLNGERMPLSFGAAKGFLRRLEASALRTRQDFREDLRAYVRDGQGSASCE